jgi:tRNA-dihydrouridine synthase B
MLKIGPINIKPALILAPMAGISDLPYRNLMRKFGCPLAFMEMVNIRSLAYNSKETALLLSSDAADRPVGAQILGKDEKYILRALDIMRKFKIDILDFNAACPVRKVVRRGEGAALLQDPKRLLKLLTLIRKNTALPLTVKIRTGWDKNSRNAPDVALACQDAGANAIFIHGRTKEQLYSGEVDYETIKKVKQTVSIPVIASGNIFSGPLAKYMLEKTGADGVILARGTLGNPWLFEEIKIFLEKGTTIEAPSLEQKLSVLFEHLESMIDFYSEKTAITLFRKFIGWYLKGTPRIRQIREMTSRIKTKKELTEILALTNK